MDATGSADLAAAGRGDPAAAQDGRGGIAPAAWARGRAGLTLGAAAAGLTGLALAVAFPAPDVGAAAFVALVPLLAFCETARVRPWRAARLGYLAGLVFFGLHMRWLTELGADRTAGVLAWAALVALEASATAAFFALAAASRGRTLRLPVLGGLAPGNVWRAAGLAGVWVAGELLRARVPFGGNAWGLLGVTQHDGGPLLPLARVVGVYGLSAVIVVVNLAAAATLTALTRRAWAPAGAWAAAAALLPLAGLLAPAMPPADGDPVRLAVVQGNATFGTDNRGWTNQAVFQRHLDGTHALGDAGTPLDLVVWGEGSADDDPLANPDHGQAIRRASEAAGAPIIVGATTVAGDDRYQTEALLFDDGGLADRYVKRRLLPFGEYIPLSGLMRTLVPATNQLPYDKIPGSELPLMHLDGVPFGTIICYESAYPEDARSLVRDGAAYVVLITNNASFGRSWLAPQHLASTQVRAVEEGRAIVHAAVSGISAVVAPDGAAGQTSGLYEEATIIGEIQPRTGLTVYARVGYLIEPALAAVGAAMVALLAAAALRRRFGHPRTNPEQELSGSSPAAAADAVGLQPQPQPDAPGQPRPASAPHRQARG